MRNNIFTIYYAMIKFYFKKLLIKNKTIKKLLTNI